MEDPTLHVASEQTYNTFSSTRVAYNVLALIILAVLAQKLIFASKNKGVFPIWAPIEIALTSHLVSSGGLGRRILSSIRRFGGSLFGITSTHQILVNLPNLDRFMSQSHHTLTAEPIQYTLMTRVFGSVDSPDLRRKLERCIRDLTNAVEQLFLNDTAATAALDKANIGRQAASFATFSSDPQKLKRWERSADTRVITPMLPGQPGKVEANFQSLVRDFGSCIAIPTLYGKDFVDRYPQLLEDFWKFDNDLFPLLMIGIPIWAPFKMVREARAARARLLVEMEALYKRIDQYQRGEPIDHNADMSDVGFTALARNKIYTKEGFTIAERGAGDLGLLWGQNANVQPTLFWLLTYVYSTPGVVERLRKEIAPYVRLSSSSPPEIVSLDISALSKQCQFFKACVFETYRLSNEPTSIRYIARPITINDGDFQHQLKPGTFVSAPHSVSQRDSSVYADPDKFVPNRFLEVDSDSDKPMARYGKLRPWGAGSSMCKGRTFAEKEILALGAAIISLWNIDAASGEWKLPDMVPGTGVKKPVTDIRVVITRRAHAED